MFDFQIQEDATFAREAIEKSQAGLGHGAFDDATFGVCAATSLSRQLNALPQGRFFYSAAVVRLEDSKLAAQLSRGEVARLLAIAHEQQFAANGGIFKEGETGDGLYVVKEGLVEIAVLVGQGTRHVLSRVEPGDFFGEMAVLDDKARSASAVAVTETAVYFLPRAEIIRLVETAPALALALLREISNRLREFNRQYLREVVQAERLAIVGRFARSIVHDLKNPLNNIGLTAEMAGLPQLEPAAREQAVATIRHQVERISDMVSEILDFTQGTGEEMVLPPVDYAEFIAHVMDEARSEAALKEVELIVESPAPSVRVLLNPKRFRRIFNNLLQNAAEAMPAGGKVFLRFTKGPGEVVTEMEDTGPGIAPEMAGQLFQAFATHGKSHGTGLGLSICKRIVEDHHGWIAARPRCGRGAIFQFGLPVVAEPPAA